MDTTEEPDSDPQTPLMRESREVSPHSQNTPSEDDHATPRKRRKKGTSSLATSVKERVRMENLIILGLHPTQRKREIEPLRGEVCVVTRFNKFMDVLEFAHVVPKSTSAGTIRKLEWVWGLERHTLNVDSPRNSHLLQISILKFFEKPIGGLSWVPSIGLLRNLDKCYEQSTRYDPEKMYNGRTTFQYNLFPFPDMEHCCAIRQYYHLYETIDPEQIIQYSYPFLEFDSISLAVPPHFVIYNTGLKLNAIFKDREPTQEEIQLELSTIRGIATRLGLCLSIYRRWMLSNPPDEFPSLHPPITQAGPSKQSLPPLPRSTRSKRSSGRSHKGGLGSGGASKRRDADGGVNDASTTLSDDSISRISGSVDYSEESGDDFEEDDVEFSRRIVKWIEDVWEKTGKREPTMYSVYDGRTCVDRLENG